MKKTIVFFIFTLTLFSIPPYWNEGLAEVAYYRLEQARYGEIHPGEMVLVTVSEPFRKEEQVKAEKGFQPNDTVVLKVISIRRFATGIYDYSLALSTFYDTEQNRLLKASFSSQDWCGQEFWQLNYKKRGYRLEWRSYFEDFKDGELNLPFSFTEDEVLARLRLNPESLPIGEEQILPSLVTFRLNRLDRKPIKAKVERKRISESLNSYEIRFPGREITFVYDAKFPHNIKEIVEKTQIPFGNETKILTTRMNLEKKERIAYWNLNKKKDFSRRKTLGLSWP